jgi:hypothetical protein
MITLPFRLVPAMCGNEPVQHNASFLLWPAGVNGLCAAKAVTINRFEAVWSADLPGPLRPIRRFQTDREDRAPGLLNVPRRPVPTGR